MNKIYRVVWNAETGQWVVASEMAKGRKKRASSASVASVLAIGACALAGMPSAHAGTVSVSTNPLKFSDTAGTTVSRKLGDTLKITGVGTTAGTFSGNNIKTVADATGGEIKIQMADAPKFGNITVNDSGKISGVAAGTAATDVVNKGQLDAAVIQAGAGWKIKANAGTEGTIKGGDTLAVVDGTNTKVAFDSTKNELKVSVADAPTFSGMVTANGGLTVGAGKTVDMGANKVTNVAAGTANTDAVNFGQLKASEQSVANALGGGSAVNSDGTITKPAYTVAEQPGQYMTCQYKVLFDDQMLARQTFWNPAGCAGVVGPVQAVQPAQPDAPARVVAATEVSADFLFDFDSGALAPGATQAIDSKVMEVLDKAERVEALRVIGFTDRLGSDAYNQQLSLKRADAVKQYLVSRGVPGEAILTSGRGSAEPVVNCPGAKSPSVVACLKPNRRVRIEVVAR